VGFDYVVVMGMGIDPLADELLQEVRHGAARPVQSGLET